MLGALHLDEEEPLEEAEVLLAETGIAYDDRAQGTLQLFRTQKQLDGIGGDVAVLQPERVPGRAVK